MFFQLSINTLRLIASQYVSDDGRVNYENVLSFISGALKEANAVRPVEHNPPRFLIVINCFKNYLCGNASVVVFVSDLTVEEVVNILNTLTNKSTSLVLKMESTTTL